MIQAKELTKIYKSRKGGTCVALDHISFHLPDKGFVFVIGKSGSGKTTLLSLLGGLDTITSGEIVENGRELSRFGLGEQVCYRNSTIGFIFQDFHLLDDLTIYENISLALEIRGEEDREKVLKALADTDLAEFENRYPKELSGGQKQRVAIARALVKQPSMILADEPTGNLDSKTTVQILDLLKELSKEKLVVIVSHNLSDAEHYADEILELSEGKILRHVKRNQAFDNRLRVVNDTLIIPYGEKFTDENLNSVNSILESGGIKTIRQESDRFLPHEEVPPETASPLPFAKKHIKLRSAAKLSVKFARRSWLWFCAYSVIFAVILVVLGLSQLIMNFNGGKVVATEMAKRSLSCTSFLKNENDCYESVDPLRILDVNEGDLQKFYDAGYEGKAYPLINFSVQNAGATDTLAQKKVKIDTNPYNVDATGGLLITDEEFVKNKFGKLEFLATADVQRDDGIFITDYLADSVILNRPDQQLTYRDLLQEVHWNTYQSWAYVNGIIYTGYKQRYKDIIEILSDPQLSKADIREFIKNEKCLEMFDELTQYLNIAYTFNKDFVDAAAKLKGKQAIASARSCFEMDGRIYNFESKYFSDESARSSKRTLKENEIIMNYETYNSVFGKSYTPLTLKDFVPHSVTLHYYLFCDQYRSVEKYEKTFTIVKLSEKGLPCYISGETFEELSRIEYFTMGYYFDNAGQTELLVNVANDNGFVPNSSIGSTITTMAGAVEVFSRFFDLIFIILCVALLILMIQFELKNVKDKMKNIGVIKALGGRDLDLIVIFGFQVLVTGLAMIALYIVGSFVFIGLANKVLVLSLSKFAKNTVVMDIAFLTVKWQYVLQNCLLALIILVLSFVVPMVRLRYIKPTNVIKAKE